MAPRSAGILLYRRDPDGLRLLLIHPGGPFWRGRDDGAWTIPKGVVGPDEALIDAAQREFVEETSLMPQPPFLPLGEIRQKAGKRVHAWAWEGDADPERVASNEMRAEHPRGSGRFITFPEVDRCGWFDPDAARIKLNPAQAAFVDRLLGVLAGTPSG